MSKTEQIKNIYQRMVEVQKVVKTIEKNETVKMSEHDKGYKAVTHDDVAAALHLPLAEAGIFMLPNVIDYSSSEFSKTNNYGKSVTWYRTDIKISVRWINVDKPEDYIESIGAAFALDTSDKSFAKAYSLALKIVLLKVHLLESRDGEEQRLFEESTGGHLSQGNKHPQQQQKQRPNNQPQGQQKPQQQAAKTQQTAVTKDVSPASPQLMNELFELSSKLAITDTELSDMAKRGWGVENSTPTFMVKELINLMNKNESNKDMVLGFVQSLEDIRKLKSKPVEDKKGNDPGQFVMPIGQNDVKGKKIVELDEAKLKSILDYAESQLIKAPPVPNVAQFLEIKVNVQKFLNSVGVKVRG